MKSMTTVVRSILAQRSDRDPRTIQIGDNLYRDLGFTALGLVLVIGDIEESENIRISIEELSAIETVGDLFAFVSAAVAREHRAVTSAHFA